MKSFKIITGGLATILILIIVTPLFRMILAADPATLKATVTDTRVTQSIMLTLRCALWATIASALFGIPLAYALARWRFPGKTLVQGIVDLPVMIPHTAAGIALLMVYGRRFLVGKAFAHVGISFVGTETGISLAMAFVSIPFLVNAARNGFLSINPRIEQVARTLGASPWQTFFRVTLPLTWRPILSGGIMMWARGISEFGAVIVLAYHPMTAPVLIWERFESYGLKYARPVAIILILLCLIIFAVLRGIASERED